MKKIIALCGLCVLMLSCKQQGYVYIDVKKVFDGFEYKKELEKELEGVKNQRKYILDSMETGLKMLSGQLKMEPKNTELMARFQINREDYFRKKEQFESDEEQMVRVYDQKIISQINSYVTAFGKEHNYPMIMGAGNDGNIMYADSTLNITKEVITYINQKYTGK